MLFYLYIIAFSTSVNTILVEDLKPLFAQEDCIEATLLTPSATAPQDVLVFDSSHTKEASIVNITRTAEVGANTQSASKVHELAQYNNLQYSYELLSDDGPPHNKMYKVRLLLGDESYEGLGSNLKKAQHEAARTALEQTYYEHPPIKLKTETEKSLTPTVVLNNVATQLGLQVSYFLINGKQEKAMVNFETVNEAYGKSKSYYTKLNYSSSLRIPTEDQQIEGPFTVKVKVGDFEYVGIAHTIQAARHDAATKAIKDIQMQKLHLDNVCQNEETADECTQRKEDLKSPVSRIYEVAHVQNLPIDFHIISESGKSHKKVFTTQCKLGEFITEGEGASKKESKRAAAEKMIKNLSHLPQAFNGKSVMNSLKTKTKRKHKKNKIIKNNIKTVANRVRDMLSSVWSTQGNLHDHHKVQKQGKPKSHLVSHKDKLLETGNMFNIHIEFIDLDNFQDEFYTVTSLGLHPAHICLGKGGSRQLAQDSASLRALKFMFRSGIFEKTFSRDKEESFRDYIFEYLEAAVSTGSPLLENSEKEH